MEEIEPYEASPPDRSYVRRPWAKYTDGRWRKFRDVPDDENSADAQENGRIRSAAYSWAKKHGFRVQSRTERNGKALYLRLHKDGS